MSMIHQEVAAAINREREAGLTHPHHRHRAELEARHRATGRTGLLARWRSWRPSGIGLPGPLRPDLREEC
jgi:hypothetical protein